MAGLLGDVSYQAAEIDPISNKRIDLTADFAGRSPEQYAKEQMAGVGEAAQMPMQSEQEFMNREKALGIDSGYNMALKNKYQKQVGQYTQKMSTLSEYEAQMERAEKLAKSQAFLTARRNIDVAVKQRQMEAEAANAAARGSVLGSVLGIAGTVAGLYFSGGNPAAGAAGGKMGSAIGEGIGG